MSGYSTPKRQLESSGEDEQEDRSLFVKRHKLEESVTSTAGAAPSFHTSFGVSNLAIRDEATLGIQFPSVSLGEAHSMSECKLKNSA